MSSIVGDRIGLAPEHPTVASLLQSAGYDTALVGKWHCGHLPTYSPLKNGFNEFFGSRSGSIDYFRHVDPSGAADLWEGDEPIEREGYATELFSERAVEFINRPRSNPFFLCLWYNAPHWPWEGPRDKDLSDEIKNYDSHRTWMETGTAENYAEVVKSLDAGVGSILQALKDANIVEDTLVVFSSDQGGDEMSYMGPYRRGRLHDGGIKVPLIVSWPGVVRRECVSEQVVMGFDITATILSAAGVKPDPRYPLDGDDLLSLLQGRKKDYRRKLYWRHAGNPRPGIPIQKAMRAGDWKYLKVGQDEFLFNLSKDVIEAVDLKERYPKKFASFREEYREWESQMLRYDKQDKNFERVVFK
jgi:arylsulfatase A-like enzyme